MPSLTEVREAVKATLEANLPGVTGYAKIPGSVNVPAFFLQPVDTDFDVAMGRGADTWNFDLVVLVALTDDKLAQDKLDPYVDGGGTSSIRKIVFNNKTLGLADTNAHIAAMNRYGGSWELGGYKYAGAALRLVVHVKPE